MKKSKKRVNRGFTLIEVMIAAGVLVISLVGLVVAGVNATKMYANQRSITQAVAVGESVTEEVLLKFETDPEINIGTSTSRYFTKNGAPTTAANAFYTVTWFVTGHPSVTGILRIRVLIQWTVNGQPKQIIWNTYRNGA